MNLKFSIGFQPTCMVEDFPLLVPWQHQLPGWEIADVLHEKKLYFWVEPLRKSFLSCPLACCSSIAIKVSVAFRAK